MADSKLKLQIITALDNAGIKATQDQINGLEKTLSKVNSSGGLSSVEKQLGNIRGPLGKLAPMFEGVGGAIAKVGGIATAAIGAFKAGWDIGSWIQEHVIAPLFGIKDPLEDLKKQNKKLAEEQQKTIRGIESMAEASASSYAESTQQINHEIQQIDKLNQAWTKATGARNAYNNADKDIEIQQLERERFEDIIRLQNEGDYEGAEQANALYDVYRSIMEGQKEIVKFDQETATIEKGLTAQIEKRKLLMDKIVQAEANIIQKHREYDAVQNNGDAYATQYDYNRAEKKAKKNITIAQNELRKLEDELAVFDASDTGMLELATREKQRAVLKDKLMLGVDQAAWSYDQRIMQNGNLLGIRFSEEFIEKLNSSSKQSYDSLEKAITTGVKNGIEQLMEVK